MISVIPHPKISLDDIGDALRGPNIRGVPACQCAAKKDLHKLSTLSRAQFQGTPRHWDSAQARLASPPRRVSPAHHGARVASDRSRHGGQGQPGDEHRNGPDPATFKFLCRSSWAHAGIPPDWDTIVLHY